VRVIGTARWDAKARDYRVLAERIRGDQPDAVYLGGYVSSNGARLIEDLRERLGPETEIIGPDGFATPGLIVESAGSDAENFTWTIATLPTDKLPPEGRELAAQFERRFSSRPCCDTTLTTIGVYRIEDGRLRFQTAITPPAELLARR
jgi:hypothetical protein